MTSSSDDQEGSKSYPNPSSTMSTGETQDPFIVPPPFDASSTGDCILSTPEGVHFKVHRAVMSIASPVFADIPQARSPDDDTPIIRVTEGPKTLTTLLTMIYPVDPPIINDLDLMLDVVEAYHKYSITLGRLRRCPGFRELLVGTAIEPELGLRLYALAWRVGLEEEAKIVSRYLHKADLKDRNNMSRLLRDSGSWDSVTELWDLRLRREQALNPLMDKIPLQLCHCSSCGGPNANTTISFNGIEGPNRGLRGW